MKLELRGREEIAEDTMEFRFSKPEDFSFKPGQFGDFTLENPPYEDDKGNRRTFSIASAPEENQILVATRMRDSAFKKSLKEIASGTKVEFMGPMGAFTLHEDTEKPAVMIAGGIGITPFRSMIKHSLEEGTGHKLYLFYSNRTPGSTAYLDEFEDLAASNENFNFTPTITDSEYESWDYEYGRVTPEMIRKNISEDVKDCIFYIVGPPGMVYGMKDTLLEAGFPEDKLETEDFSGY